MNKGNYMAVFDIADPNANYEVTKFKFGRYVNSNEAFWQLFSFPIHEFHPTVVHLKVHMEKGQYVYFRAYKCCANSRTNASENINTFFFDLLKGSVRRDFSIYENTTLLYTELCIEEVSMPKSTTIDKLNACLKSSSLWRHVKKLKFTTNMRVALQNHSRLLALGNSQISVDVTTRLILFPANFCKFTSSKEELITKMFPGVAENYKNPDWISERAILVARIRMSIA